jgi:hypothetical protein
MLLSDWWMWGQKQISEFKVLSFRTRIPWITLRCQVDSHRDVFQWYRFASHLKTPFGGYKRKPTFMLYSPQKLWEMQNRAMYRVKRLSEARDTCQHYLASCSWLLIRFIKRIFRITQTDETELCASSLLIRIHIRSIQFLRSRWDSCHGDSFPIRRETIELDVYSFWRSYWEW